MYYYYEHVLIVLPGSNPRPSLTRRDQHRKMSPDADRGIGQQSFHLGIMNVSALVSAAMNHIPTAELLCGNSRIQQYRKRVMAAIIDNS